MAEETLTEALSNLNDDNIKDAAVPVHKQLIYKKFAKKNTLEITEKISKEILSLPIYPELNTRQTSKIVNLIKKYYNQ